VVAVGAHHAACRTEVGRCTVAAAPVDTATVDGRAPAAAAQGTHPEEKNEGAHAGECAESRGRCPGTLSACASQCSSPPPVSSPLAAPAPIRPITAPMP